MQIICCIYKDFVQHLKVFLPSLFHSCACEIQIVQILCGALTQDSFKAFFISTSIIYFTLKLSKKENALFLMELQHKKISAVISRKHASFSVYREII